MAAALRLLLLEDNDGDARLIREELTSDRRAGEYEVSRASTLAEAVRLLGADRYDAALVDLTLPDSSGADTPRRIREAAPSVPVVVLTGLDDDDAAVRAVAEGAQDYLVKGRDGPLVARSIRYAIERHRLLQDLDAARRAELEMKDRFISHISHELRNPLASSYLITTNLLEEFAGPLSTEQRENLEIVLANVNRLREMIDDLIEATRSETSRARLHLREFPLDETVAGVMKDMTSRATQLTWRQEVPSGLPPVLGDRDRVAQVLRHLLVNAVKFTPPGGTITVRAATAATGELTVEVEDTGCGIPPDVQPRIFERLYQHSQTDARYRSGLGLGLYICREIVRQHGGRIWVESEAGKGSRFVFTLPTANSVATTERNASS